MLSCPIAHIKHRYFLFNPYYQPILVNIHRRAGIDVRPDGLDVNRTLSLDELIHLLVDPAHNNAQTIVQRISVRTLHNRTSPVLPHHAHACIYII